MTWCGGTPTEPAAVVDTDTAAQVDNTADAKADTVKVEADAEAAPAVAKTWPVAKGDMLAVNYIGSTQADGAVFDTSLEDVAKENDLYNEQRPYAPLEFEVGAGQMIPGFDSGVVGMNVGETKVLQIAAADGYGERSDENIKSDVPTQPMIDAGVTPEIGEQYNFGIGIPPGTVTEINGDMMTVDFNHFLAGKDLEFEVTVVEIK